MTQNVQQASMIRRLFTELRRRLTPCPHNHRLFYRDEETGVLWLRCEACGHLALALKHKPVDTAKRERLDVRLRLSKAQLRRRRGRARRVGVVVPMPRALSG